MDTKAQALAEEAIVALGEGDGPRAGMAIEAAANAESTLMALADAVHLACSELAAHDEIPESTWNMLADAVGPGPLADAVESARH